MNTCWSCQKASIGKFLHPSIFLVRYAWFCNAQQFRHRTVWILNWIMERSCVLLCENSAKMSDNTTLPQLWFAMDIKSIWWSPQNSFGQLKHSETDAKGETRTPSDFYIGNRLTAEFGTLIYSLYSQFNRSLFAPISWVAKFQFSRLFRQEYCLLSYLLSEVQSTLLFLLHRANRSISVWNSLSPIAVGQ